MDKASYREISKIIARFTEELRKEIPVEKVFLYGSYATGKADRHSDIDIIVVSPAFSEGNPMKHTQYLFRKASKINTALEPLPAAPADIQNADTRGFLGQALKYAKMVF